MTTKLLYANTEGFKPIFGDVGLNLGSAEINNFLFLKINLNQFFIFMYPFKNLGKIKKIKKNKKNTCQEI